MDRRNIGPVYGPERIDEHGRRDSELAKLRIEREGRRRNRLSELPGDIREAGRRIEEGTQKWVTRPLLETGNKIANVVHDDPGGRRRELALSSEHAERKNKEYAEALEQNQTEWQKKGEKIRDDIRKLPDNAVGLYEPYPEYPFNANFNNYEEAKAKAADKRNDRISLLNQSVSLYFWNAIKSLESLKITDKPEFQEMMHFLNTLRAKISDSADLDKAAREFEKQAGLANAQIAHSQKRRREGDEHSASIQSLPDRIGRATHPERLLKAGNVKQYSEQAEERAKELESVLAHVEKHRQDTEAKIGVYLSQAQKRADAVTEATARENAVNRTFQRSGRRAINEAIIRTTNARNRATANPIGNRRYKDIADIIITHGINAAPIAIEATRESRAAGLRAQAAGLRAQAAEARAQDAERRAQDAERRARIAKAHNDPQISDELAKNVEKHARDCEKLEKEVASNAYVIQANEIKIQNELRSIAQNLRLMRVTTMRHGLTPEDRRKSLAELADKVEKAEAAKNSATAFELQATEKEQTALENIRVSLEEEAAALVQERNNAQRITDLATVVTQDINVLQNLVNQQRTLEENLRGRPGGPGVVRIPGLIERERDESQAAQAIQQAILSRKPNLADVATPTGGRLNLKARELTRRRRVEARRMDFEGTLQRVRVAERAAAEALKRNAIHMEGDVTDDAEQAIERLQKIKDNLADQDDAGLKNRSKGHLFIDPKLGKATINGVWTSIREIDGWEPPDPTSPGETRLRYRPDIVKIEVETITREAQGGKLSVEPIYTKRLSKRFFRSADFEYTLEIPGDSFANGGRRQATMTVIDVRKKDGTIARPGGGQWLLPEYQTIQKIPMEAAGTIKIKENHNNQSQPIEVMFSSDIEVMPAPVINHEAALALRQGEGWSDEEKRRMSKLDLDRRLLILPNGLEFPMDKFDWTETKWDQENGLTLQYKGPKELSQVNLLAAGSSDIFDEKLLDSTTAVEEKKRNHLEDGIELLKRAIKSYDENKINAVIGYMRSSEGIDSYQSSVAKNELERPPKNGLDLERLKKKKKAQRERDAQTPKSVAHSMESAAGMLGATQSYEEVVKKHIRTIHENDPLSAERVWQSHANPGEYALDKHRSSQRKQELRDEIRAANHLDKTVHFQLLEDPKQGPTSVVKNAAPNGSELLQDYNRYIHQLDIDNQFANQIERQNVAQYVANITTEFQINSTIHPYYVNQWNLEQAMAAARDGNFLGKEVDDKHVMGVSEYISKLKQVDCPQSSDKSLAGLRQADEYHWVTYLRDALAEADREGMAELLKQALPIAKQQQECRDSNLKLAEKALDLETPSEEAKKMEDDMHTVEPSLLWPKIDEKPTAVDKDKKSARNSIGKDKKSDGKFDPKAMINKSDGELALEAGGITEQIYKQAVNSIEGLIGSTNDPFLQLRYREAAVKMAMDLAKQAFEINKQDKSIQNQWQKLDELTKQMNSQRWKDYWFTLAVFAFQQGPRAGAEGVKKFMDEIMKILTKAI